MSINIGPPASEDLRPRITVIGVGGAGGNAVGNMIAAEVEGVDFIVANTDAQSLGSSEAEKKIQLGPDITGGLGAGARPEVGRAAAEETAEEIERTLEGVNMCFIAAGMGGGTGTGAAPVIAEAARKAGVLTIGVVTKPFLFEGTRRMRAAEAGIEELQKHVDTLIVIPNQNLFLVAKAETTFKEAFLLADEVLQQGVRSITDLMVMPGLINLDFADVRSVMMEAGKAMMGTGEGEGENRALEAAERAIANPLLDGVSMQGAKGVIISIIGGDDMRLLEVDEAANHIRELVDDDANIIWGSAFNPDLQGRIRVSVVATGIDEMGDGSGSGERPVSLSGSRPSRRPAMALDTTFDDDDGDEDDDYEPAGLSIPRAYGGEPAATDAQDEADAGEAIVEPADDSANVSDDEGFVSADTGSDSYADDDDDGDDWGLPQTDGATSDAATGDEDESVGRESESRPRPAVYDDVSDPHGAATQEPLDLIDEAGSGYGGADEASPSGSGSRAPAQPVDDSAPTGEGRPLGRRRGLVSRGEGDDGAAPAEGSTLFERMANLSRSKGSGLSGAGGGEDEDEDDEGEGSGSLNIPRFLGRQNNQ